MEETLARYRRRIQEGRINPLIRWDGRTNRVLFDPDDGEAPLLLLGLSACWLDNGPVTLRSGQREFVLVPIDAAVEVNVGSEVFKAERNGGPFAALPGQGNACAVYVPRDAESEISGRGELIVLSAPARGDKPPALVSPGSRPYVRRGSGVWHRDVCTLFSPEDVTTHLVGGETYSPPGLWSGTPLHVHDKNDPCAGQSDHEEVYYHLARETRGAWEAYGVQLLFDDAGLDKAYMIHNRDAFAIPGAAHPVVAGPMSDMLYVWALAGRGDQLLMRDVPEFQYLKVVGDIIDELDETRPRQKLADADVKALAHRHGLAGNQTQLLLLHLRERGF